MSRGPPRHHDRRCARRCGRMGVQCAVPEHPHAVVAVIPALLAAARSGNRPSTARRRRQPLNRAPSRSSGAPPGLADNALALDRRRRPGTKPVWIVVAASTPGGRAPRRPSRARRARRPGRLGRPAGRRCSSPGVAATGLAEADNRLRRHPVGDSDRQGDVRGFPQPGRLGDIYVEVDRTHDPPAAITWVRACAGVEPDAKPVEHRVLDDGHGQLAVLLGWPRRLGKAASLVSVAANSSGMPLVSPVLKRLGAMAMARMPRLPRSWAMVNTMPTTPNLAVA